MSQSFGVVQSCDHQHERTLSCEYWSSSLLTLSTMFRHVFFLLARWQLRLQRLPLRATMKRPQLLQPQPQQHQQQQQLKLHQQHPLRLQLWLLNKSTRSMKMDPTQLGNDQIQMLKYKISIISITVMKLVMEHSSLRRRMLKVMLRASMDTWMRMERSRLWSTLPTTALASPLILSCQSKLLLQWLARLQFRR